jgi:hypothetical protein
MISLTLASPDSDSLRFFIYPDPMGSEEPELVEAKINLLPLGLG